MRIAQIVAVVGVLCLLAAVAVLSLHEPEVATTQAPRNRGGKVRLLVAKAPEIGDFQTEFHVNNENPFVPWNLRQEEIAAIRRPKQPPQTVKIRPPTDLPVPVTPPKPPEKSFPPLEAPRPAEPDPVGVVLHSSGRSALVVRLGEQPPVRIESGQELDGWRLIGFDADSASFLDPRGETRRYTINVAQTGLSGGGGTDESPAPAPQPAPMPAPRPNGDGARPGGNGTTGGTPPSPGGRRPKPPETGSTPRTGSDGGRGPRQARVDEGDIPPMVPAPKR